MRPPYRIRSRDEGRYLEAVDEARENVFFARREYYDALDEKASRNSSQAAMRRVVLLSACSGETAIGLHQIDGLSGVG